MRRTRHIDSRGEVAVPGVQEGLHYFHHHPQQSKRVLGLIFTDGHSFRSPHLKKDYLGVQESRKGKEAFLPVA